eukprot:Skav206627  [mRNA]  locus=scaffold2321:59750:63011:- [translate_table: standard]
MFPRGGSVKSAMASPISSINWQAHCGSRRGSNISAAVSQIAEADLPTVPEKPPPRMKAAAPAAKHPRCMTSTGCLQCLL